LMSYGPDLTESFERAADLVGRIFKGWPASRPAVRAADALPLRAQPEDRQGHGPYRPADGARAGGRGDRMKEGLVRRTSPILAQTRTDSLLKPISGP
jgi:hypothetical protein